MFTLYAVIYAGFVVVNLVRPGLMEKAVIAGLNLAVVYGFGLIIFALILALVLQPGLRAPAKRNSAPPKPERRPAT